MTKIDLSERMKLSCVSIIPDLTIASIVFPITLAKDEIILLHACKYMDCRGSGLAINEMRVLLYKKPDNIPTSLEIFAYGDWQYDKSVIDAWFSCGNSVRTAESLAPIPPLYQVYPKPIFLIRPPALVYRATDATSVVTVLLWYQTVKVSDKDLLELMVKDHA